jgi:hypothetical protein
MNAIDSEGGRDRERELDVYFGLARAHADTADTRQWITDLEDMLRVAWDLMTSEQREAFCTHADILALDDAVNGGSAAT